MDDIVSSTINQSQQTDTASDPFKVNEIICLENDSRYLYGEVIQILATRGLCWFRPMCLVVCDLASDSTIEQTQLIDLHSGSDLLWPINLFRPALDTEVISWLPLLSDRHLANKSLNKQSLNRFIQQVWQDNRDKF